MDHNDSVDDSQKPTANPCVLLREEFDDWAVPFNPDTGRGFGLNRVGVYLWKLFDGRHSVHDIAEVLDRDAREVPQEAAGHIITFIEELAGHGLVGHNLDQVHNQDERLTPTPRHEAQKVLHGEKRLAYAPLRLEPFTMEGSARGDSCQPGSQANAGACPGSGETACMSGNFATFTTNNYVCYTCFPTGNHAQGGYTACSSGPSASGGQYNCSGGSGG